LHCFITDLSSRLLTLEQNGATKFPLIEFKEDNNHKPQISGEGIQVDNFAGNNFNQKGESIHNGEQKNQVQSKVRAKRDRRLREELVPLVLVNGNNRAGRNVTQRQLEMPNKSMQLMPTQRDERKFNEYVQQIVELSRRNPQLKQRFNSTFSILLKENEQPISGNSPPRNRNHSNSGSPKVYGGGSKIIQRLTLEKEMFISSPNQNPSNHCNVNNGRQQRANLPRACDLDENYNLDRDSRLKSSRQPKESVHVDNLSQFNDENGYLSDSSFSLSLSPS